MKFSCRGGRKKMQNGEISGRKAGECTRKNRLRNSSRLMHDIDSRVGISDEINRVLTDTDFLFFIEQTVNTGEIINEDVTA